MKRNECVTLSAALTAATVSVVISVKMVSAYKKQFNELSQTMAALDKTIYQYDVDLSPVIVSKSKKILSIVDDNDADIKQGFNTRLSLPMIIRLNKRGIDIKYLNELDKEVKKVISYTYLRYGITVH